MEFEHVIIIDIVNSGNVMLLMVMLLMITWLVWILEDVYIYHIYQ